MDVSGPKVVSAGVKITLTHILLMAILACLIYALINGWG